MQKNFLHNDFDYSNTQTIKEVFTFHKSLFDTKSCNIYRVFVISRCEHTRESIAHANRVSLIHRGTLHAYFFSTQNFFSAPFPSAITHFHELFSATHGSTRRFRALHSEKFSSSFGWEKPTSRFSRIIYCFSAVFILTSISFICVKIVFASAVDCCTICTRTNTSDLSEQL